MDGQRRHRLGLAVKPRDPFGVSSVRIRQALDRDLAIELRVTGAINLAHAARPEQADDLVRAEPTTDGQSQDSVLELDRLRGL